MAKLVQVNNLIALGGTTTCAAAVCRALAEWEHEVLSLGGVHGEAAEAWLRARGVGVRRVKRVAAADLAGADFCLLNNTPAAVVDGPLPVPTVSWHHSAIRDHAPGNVTLTVSRHLNGVEQAEHTVLHQGVPDDRDATRRRWARLRETKPPFYVGLYSTPNRAKFPPDLPDVIEAIDVEELRVEIVGGEHLRKRLGSGPLGRRVRFLRPGPHVGRRLWRWHVLLFRNGPRVTETFGRCVVEAMMAGCVPVTDRRGGPCETVVDGKTGRLCETADAFAEAVGALADRAHWETLCRQARDHARRRFSLAALRARLVDVFETALRNWHEGRL